MARHSSIFQPAIPSPDDQLTRESSCFSNVAIFRHDSIRSRRRSIGHMKYFPYHIVKIVFFAKIIIEVYPFTGLPTPARPRHAMTALGYPRRLSRKRFEARADGTIVIRAAAMG